MGKIKKKYLKIPKFNINKTVFKHIKQLNNRLYMLKSSI